MSKRKHEVKVTLNLTLPMNPKYMGNADVLATLRDVLEDVVKKLPYDTLNGANLTLEGDLGFGPAEVTVAWEPPQKVKRCAT